MHFSGVNYASLKGNVIYLKPRFLVFLLVEILLSFAEAFILHWLLLYVK